MGSAVNIENIKQEGARAELVRVAEYCKGLAGEHGMPRRQALSLYDMLWVLPHCFLIDVVSDEPDYLFRFMGSIMSRMYGADFTGLRLSGVGNANMRNLLRATYNAALATQTPLYLRGKYTWPAQEIDVERLLVPLADERGHHASVLGVVFTDAPEDQLDRLAGFGPALFVPSHPKAHKPGPAPKGESKRR